MEHKLVYDEEDPNYILLDEIMDIVDSRKTKMIMARNFPILIKNVASQTQEVQ